MTGRDKDRQLAAIEPAIMHTRRFLLSTLNATEAAAYADIALESLTKALAAIRSAPITSEQQDAP